MYNCANCLESAKGFCDLKKPVCHLKTMIIEQLVQPGKIDNFAAVLDRLGYRFVQIGSNDFLMEKV